MFTYTNRDKTVKRHPVSKAIANAKILLNGVPMCVNALRKYSDDDLLTTVELDELVQEIVDDSRFGNM